MEKVKTKKAAFRMQLSYPQIVSYLDITG